MITPARRALIALASSLAALAGCEREPAAARVTFWTISLRPTFNAYMNERIGAFEAEHPGVDVEWVDVPFEVIERKLLAAAAAGRPPDVVNLSDMMFARFAAAGAFADLEGLEGIADASLYHGPSLDVGRIGGVQLALPWYLTTQSAIVNTRLLERGGLTLETLGRSWPEVMTQARAFHERTGAFLVTQPIGTDSQLPMMLIASGLTPLRLDERGRVAPDLAREDVAVFLEAWAGIYRDGALPRESATRGFEHLIDVYQNERVAMVNTGANFLLRVRDASRQVYDVTAVRPPLVGELGAAHIAVMPVCVSAATREPLAAARWASFITSPQSQLAFCRLAPILPSTPASMEDPFFRGPTPAEVSAGLETVGEARAIVAEAVRGGAPFTPGLEAWPEMRRVFNERFKAVLLGGEDLRGALRQIDRQWAGILDAMNERRAAIGAEPAGAEVLDALAELTGDGA